ncbi:hypothetical protein AM493_14455 [Flavobacterium akiainvivens]|uniref:SdpI/YhfL protein family n=1 Tax=Flavobacterium akiainvivens TaxID=1202724 RepID=A0A0M8MED0_9FLAO|nr:SdpI family protein [Flavobacterium akiainvivens]KOS07104.1 hypothetical protein AM493_14455 [Flavobacterium akiainvivens]SFQ75661.1 SdpI/YhfL protein family protein [Flavobacterium akiainvivens]
MDEFVLHIMAPSLLCGIIFMIAGVIMYLYPPKKINYLYGYRTGSSMKSQERWDFAQKFSTVLMLRAAVVMVVISLLAALIPGQEETKMIGGLVLALLCGIYLFVGTEKALKNKFSN